MAKRLLVLALLLVLGALFLVVAVGVFQRRLIYMPMGKPGTPAEAGLSQAREVTFGTADGLELRAWFVPRSRPGVGPAVLFLPGNAGNRSFRAPLASALTERGASVLLVDYRGYAGHPGQPSEEGLAADARAALRCLRGLPGVDPARIVIFGESLGCGVAVTLAAESPPAALVLRSPFSSLTSVARLHYPFLPVRWLLRDRYESTRRIADVGCPVLILAGDRDRIIPIEESRRLFEAARQPKRFAVIPDAGHNDLELLAGRRLLDAVESFLEESRVPLVAP